MNDKTTMTFGQWMVAVESLATTKRVTALTVRPSPTWGAYHQLGLTPHDAFEDLLANQVETWGVSIRVAYDPGEPTHEVMALEEWMTALYEMTKTIAGIGMAIVPSHIWLVDYRNGLTPEQSFNDVVGQVIRDIGMQLELADRSAL